MAEVSESQNEHEGELPFEITDIELQNLWDASYEFRAFALHVAYHQEWTDEMKFLLKSDRAALQRVIVRTYREGTTNMKGAIRIAELYAKEKQEADS